MEYTITNDVAPPDSTSLNQRYPFTEMEVGQCAVFKTDSPGFNDARVRVAANAVGRNHNKQFTTRLDRKDGVLRVWRIK